MTGVDADGMLRSSVWQEYSSHMNYLLARCLHESAALRGKRSAAAPPVVSAMSLHPTGTDPMRDWGMLFQLPHVLWDETMPDDAPFNTINACTPLRARV